MSQLLHLATLEDLQRLLPMVAAYHAFDGIESDEAHREAALRPVLVGVPHGAIWLIGPKIAPVGYVCVSFGWSLELGGLDGMIDEFWIREKIRGRGMGSETLVALQKALQAAGVRAVSLEVADINETATRLYRRAGFKARDYRLMTWRAPDQVG
ncbi:GNAT family N-acetyltransferase [bacterium]|nr:GNAT family N-acetyltransferase [bacterium]